MRYKVVVEYDPETRHYTATVAGLPGVIADAKTERSAIKLAREGIAFFREEQARVPAAKRAPPMRAKVVTVNV